MIKKLVICLNYGHFERKNEISDCISKSLSQQNLRCLSPLDVPDFLKRTFKKTSTQRVHKEVLFENFRMYNTNLP